MGRLECVSSLSVSVCVVRVCVRPTGVLEQLVASGRIWEWRSGQCSRHNIVQVSNRAEIMSSLRYTVGLSTIRLSLNIFADGGFSNGFRHAESNGARKKIYFNHV